MAKNSWYNVTMASMFGKSYPTAGNRVQDSVKTKRDADKAGHKFSGSIGGDSSNYKR